MKIIVGLGNIGEKYLFTRHNCGFITLDTLVEDLEENEKIKVNWKEDNKLKGVVARFPYKDNDILLLKPSTLMNLSGEAVSKTLNFYKESPENIIIVYDDIDLMLGTLRLKDKGSAGSHNGMKSVIESLGTEKFKRLRIGIESRGELTHKNQDLTGFVLSGFTESEIPLLKKAVHQAVGELKKFMAD